MADDEIRGGSGAARWPAPRPTVTAGPDLSPPDGDDAGSAPDAGTAPGEAHEIAIRPLLDVDGTALLVLDADGTVLEANATMCAIVGARSVEELTPDSAAAGVIRSFLDHLPADLRHHERGQWHGDIDHRDRAGDATTLRATVSVLGPGDPVPGGAGGGPAPAGDTGGQRIAMLLHDVTAARRRARELRHRAGHDPLTGLANRQRILDHLAASVADRRLSRPGDHLAAIFVDLDHLKYVNDAFGHLVGDRLIVSTARRLADAVRPNDRVARIGGDEFLVVGGGVEHPDDALALAERLRAALTGRLHIGELDLDFSVSVGVTVDDEELLELDDASVAVRLIGQADTAMYEAKRRGRGRSVLYTSQMRSEARERAEMASALSRAVADGTLGIDYQTIFSTVGHDAVGVEAFVRWTDPVHGVIDPATFVSVAEEAGVIARLGEQVLARAVTDLARWEAEGSIGPDFSLHINTSRVQLASNAFVGTVLGVLRTHGVDPSRLVLEVRETALAGRTSDVDRSIRALRRDGVNIAVDDFGPGSKALAVMTDVGADLLKLDSALALPEGSPDSQLRVVRAIVLLAHALEMEVVAERVSSVRQLDHLVAAGCDRVQGDLLSAPCGADDLDFSPSDAF